MRIEGSCVKTLNYRRFARKAERLGINSIARWIGSWRGLLVLTYHRIGDPRDCELDRGVFSTDVGTFATQMDFLQRHFEVVSIEDVIDRSPDYWSKRQSVLITFDDGYIDNYTHAFPILRDRGIPALFFVTSGFVDNRPLAWWDEIANMLRIGTAACDCSDIDSRIERTLEEFYELPTEACDDFLNEIAENAGCTRSSRDNADVWMTWDMLREMTKHGMSFGGHTVTHPILTRGNESWQFELAEGKRRIESETQTKVSAFSYPVGTPECISEELKSVTADHYEVAFGCYGGVNNAKGRNGWDRMEMQRWPIFGSMRQFQTTVTWPQLRV